jgi:hypothetical protein
MPIWNDFIVRKTGLEPAIFLAPHVDRGSSDIVFPTEFFHTLPLFKLFQNADKSDLH